MTKTDLAAPEAVAALTRRLTALNPRAPLHLAVDGTLDPQFLIESAAGFSSGDNRRSGFVAEAEHTDSIRSFVVTEPAAMAWKPFAQAMETLIALRGPDLLRVKGLLNVAGCRGAVVVQFVQHLAHPPVELDAWPDADHATRLVFITRNIGEAAVRDLFGAVRALAQAEDGESSTS